MTTDAQFHAQCRADAIRAGMSPRLADYVVSQLGKVSARVLAGDERTSPQRRTPRAFTARAVTPTGDDRLARMCLLYPGANAVASELRAAGIPLQSVASMFASVADPRGLISKAGADAIRFRIMQAQMRKGASR